MTDHGFSYLSTHRRSMPTVRSAIDGDGNLDEGLVPTLRAMMELGRASVNEVCRTLAENRSKTVPEVAASNLVRLRKYGVLSVSRAPDKDSPHDYNVYELLVYEEAFCDALLGKHFLDKNAQRWVAWAWETAHDGPVILLRPLAEDAPRAVGRTSACSWRACSASPGTGCT